MLQAMGWALSEVPFYFRVVHSARFLHGMRAARVTPWRAALMDLAAWTGAGYVGVNAIQKSRTRLAGAPAFQEVGGFGAWADQIWEASHRAYGTVAVRSSEILGQLYPEASARFLRLQVGTAGWAVMLDTAMRNDRYFGDLRVGTIVDCLAKPDDTALVIRAARGYLEERGVDLIVSNQSHPAWTEALKGDGFFRRPSNFLLGTSPALGKIVASDCHVNRGDGDGPVHL